MHSPWEEAAGVTKGSSTSTFKTDDPERQGRRLLCCITHIAAIQKFYKVHRATQCLKLRNIFILLHCKTTKFLGDHFSNHIAMFMLPYITSSSLALVLIHTSKIQNVCLTVPTTNKNVVQCTKSLPLGFQD